MSLGVDTTALGLSFLINLIFSRIHELEGLPEDTFPDRGQTTQTAVILCVRVCVRACVCVFVCKISLERLDLLLARSCLCASYLCSTLCLQTAGHRPVMWQYSQGICDLERVEE